MPHNTQSLYLTEIYSSVQGETSLLGWPTLFVRLSGCNLRCRWCDTPYSFKKGKEQPLDTITSDIEQHGLRHVCITGGEPLLQKNVHPLMTALCDSGHIVSIETGGSLPTDTIDSRVRVILDIKCPGSGMSDRNHWENLKTLRSHDEVKFVLADRKDYLYSLDICNQHKLFDRDCDVLLSPVHEELCAKELIGWMIEDKLRARLNLQVHKYIWSPKTQGV